MKYLLIACKVFYREVCYCVSQSPHEVDIHFLPQGIHNYGKKGMREGIAKTLSGIDEARYDAILLAYGLCNNGLAELKANKIPMVIARAHDCLTLFMGNKETYQRYFLTHPGTYYLTSGWIERSDDQHEVKQLGLETRDPTGGGLSDLIEKYGEEKAKYLWEKMFGNTHYSRIAFIEMGIEPNDKFENQAREEAIQKHWEFEKLRGDIRLIRSLVNGDWNEDEFLIIPPGYKIMPSIASTEIIKAVKA